MNQVKNSSEQSSQRMETCHNNFGSIDQFRSFLKEVRDRFDHIEEKDKPKRLNLRGTVKLHGTHADIVFTRKDDDIISWCQSRNRVITVGSDNCGFAKFVEDISIEDKEKLFLSIEEIYKKEGEKYGKMEKVMIAGEFCGENIQKGVALSKLPKMFVIFAIKINDVWQHLPPYHSIAREDLKIYNISKAPVYKAVLNMDDTESIVPELKKITDEVEKECPFGKSFGVSGIGEGVVWVCEDLPCSTRYWFKVKGEEHANSTVKTLKEKSTEEKEALKNATEFAKKATLEPRLKQGFDYLREQNLEPVMRNIGVYLKWVVEDVLKEEGDSMKEYQVSESLLRKEVSKIAKDYYIKVMKLACSL